MKTKAKDDILIVRRKAKPHNDSAKAKEAPGGKQAQAKTPAVSKEIKLNREPNAVKETPSLAKSDIPRHSSLVSRITAFYTNMFATWLSISLAVIFLLVIVFNVLFMVYDTKPAMDAIGQPADVKGFVETVNSGRKYCWP